jgi:drug/metabolite transporter (DMT)-like permease
MPAVTVALVAFALAAAVSWGLSDFGGGLTSRRGPFLGVLLLAQGAGLVAAIPLTAVSGEAPLAGADLGIAGLCGLVGTGGLICLYRGLSTGRMGVVAPVAGVITAAIPVVVGIALQGMPGLYPTIGIGLAIVAVVLVSTSTDTASGRPSGILWAVGAGLLIGSFSALISRLSVEATFWPMLVVRAVQTAILLVAIVATRSSWRLPPGLWRAVVVIGLLDMFGNVFYLAALHEGALAVAAILSSLYPVVTVILAIAFLRERLTGSHAIGIVAAGVAIALISAGS